MRTILSEWMRTTDSEKLSERLENRSERKALSIGGPLAPEKVVELITWRHDFLLCLHNKNTSTENLKRKVSKAYVNVKEMTRLAKKVEKKMSLSEKRASSSRRLTRSLGAINKRNDCDWKKLGKAVDKRYNESAGIQGLLAGLFQSSVCEKSLYCTILANSGIPLRKDTASTVPKFLMTFCSWNV